MRKETLTAQLRNKLTPAYSLAEMIVLSEDNPEFFEMCVEQAKLSLYIQPEIDELLEQFDYKVITKEYLKEVMESIQDVEHYNTIDSVLDII